MNGDHPPGKPDKPPGAAGRRRRALELGLGFVLTAVLLLFFCWNVDWTAVGRAFVAADRGLLTLALAAVVLGLFVRAWRWQILLRPLAEVPFRSCWKTFNIGLAVTALLPGRLGELLRPLLLGREQHLPFASVFATVVTERIIDMLMVLLFLSSIFVFPGARGPRPEHALFATLQAVGVLALAVTVTAVVALVVLRYRTDALLRLVRWLSRPLPDKLGAFVIKLLEAFAEGLGGLRGWRALLGLASGTVAYWLLSLSAFWVALRGFQIQIPIHHTFFLVAVIALGVVVPTPAGLGAYHAAVLGVLHHLWLVEQARTYSYAIGSHLLIFAPVLVIGVTYLLRDGIDIWGAASQAEQQDRAPGTG